MKQLLRWLTTVTDNAHILPIVEANHVLHSVEHFLIID